MRFQKETKETDNKEFKEYFAKNLIHLSFEHCRVSKMQDAEESQAAIWYRVPFGPWAILSRVILGVAHAMLELLVAYR